MVDDIDYINLIKRVCKMLGLSFSLSNIGENGEIIPMIFSEYGEILIRKTNGYIMNISNIHYHGFNKNEICKNVIEESLSGYWYWDEIVRDQISVSEYECVKEGKLAERYFEFPNTIEKLIMYLDLRGY